MKKIAKEANKKSKVIEVYDESDTTNFIDKNKPKRLGDLGFSLPKEGPTKVISIRIPTPLYNKIRAFSTNIDMPYQAYMKYLLYAGLNQELLPNNNKGGGKHE